MKHTGNGVDIAYAQPAADENSAPTRDVLHADGVVVCAGIGSRDIASCSSATG